MRREGFELLVGPPTVITKNVDGKTFEPFENVEVQVRSCWILHFVLRLLRNASHIVCQVSGPRRVCLLSRLLLIDVRASIIGFQFCHVF